MFIRSLVLALVVTATAYAILLGDARFIFICEPHMQALKTTLLALRHDLNCALLSARTSARLWTYEHLVMRPAYARDRAQMSVAYGIEADLRYGVSDESRWLNLSRYVTGYLEGLFARQIDETFVDSWFQPLRGTYCSRSGIKVIAQPVTDAEADLLVGNERAAFVLKDLCGAVLLVIAPEDPWTHMSLRSLADSAAITARVAQSGGADAFLGGVWIGGTEV